MKRVTLLTCDFAPSSDPPSLRARLFCRHLPDFGWTPTVVTLEARHQPRRDPDIERLLPEELRVVRVGALPRGMTRWFGIGDPGLRGYFALRRALDRHCRNERPDAVVIHGPSFYAFLHGPRIALRHGVPYVLDYIDPWVSSMGADAPPWRKWHWARRLAVALEPRVLRHAAHVVSVSELANSDIRERYPRFEHFDDRFFSAIPYGAEPADIEHLERHSRPLLFPKRPGMLRISYVGAMLPRAYGTLRAVFAAVSQLFARRPELRSRTELLFVGTTYATSGLSPLVKPVADAMGLGDVVRESPARVPYLDALNLLRHSDVVLALGSDERHYTASKIFSCVLARRPLAAVFHAESSAAEFLRQIEYGELVTFDGNRPAEQRIDAIAAALERALDRGNGPQMRWREEAFEEYTARAMTGRLAAALDRVRLGAAGPSGDQRGRARPVRPRPLVVGHRTS